MDSVGSVQCYWFLTKPADILVTGYLTVYKSSSRSKTTDVHMSVARYGLAYAAVVSLCLYTRSS